MLDGDSTKLFLDFKDALVNNENLDQFWNDYVILVCT